MKNVTAHLKEACCNHNLHPYKQPFIIPITQSNNDGVVASIATSLKPTAMNPTLLTSSTSILPVTHPLPQHDSCQNHKAAIRLMQNTWATVTSCPSVVQVHIDGGANRSITNLRDHLLKYQNIKKYPMSGVAAGDAALVCTGIGYLPWQADTGEIILVKCYYSSAAADTIISPTDIVVNGSTYDSWEQYSHIPSGKGHIKFHRTDGLPAVTYHLTMSNGLWFHNNVNDNTDYATRTSRKIDGEPIIHHLHKNAEYHLNHFQNGCAGQRILSIIHLHVDNQPKLQKHDFFACRTCMLATGDCRSTTEAGEHTPMASFDNWFDDTNDPVIEA